MSFWHRINQPKLKWQTLTRQFKRCYLQIPHAHSLNNTPRQTIRGFENPCWVNRRNPSDFCYNVRFFAAPVQAKPKQEEKDASGPRMNDQIRADFVRLVTDDGHEIVSRMVALERARKLKLDLVEVQRKADPPVCKIMDFHREKYKQQIKEKDRTKSKSELTLRKGDCKEVRFSGKTEAKDLKMKADMVKRLMDRGYRVKCMAMGTEDQDLGGLLTRLSSLIEDVCFVESGPRVEKRQAYVIVRHIKFGPSKKGSGKKASKVVGVTSSEAATMSPTISPTINPSSHVESPIQLEEESDTAESDLENEDEVLSDEADTPISPSMRMADKNLEDNKATWSVFDANDDFDKVFDFTNDANPSNSTDKQTNAKLETSSSLENINLSDIMHGPRPVLDSTRMNSVPSSLTEPPPETLNRYRKSEPRDRFMPTTSMDNKGPGATNSLRLGPQFLNQGKQARSDTNSSPSTGRTRQDGTDASVFRNLKLPLHEIPMQEPSRPPSSPRPSYGDFSALKAEAPGKLDPSANSARSEPRLPNQGKQSWSDLNFVPSTGGTKQVPADTSVSRNSKPPTNDGPKPEQSHPVPPSSPTSSYGIFSASKATAPGKQGMASEVNRNKEGNPSESARNPSAGGVFNANFPSKSDGSQRGAVNQDGQGGWGMFSREGSKVIPSRTSESEAKVQR